MSKEAPQGAGGGGGRELRGQRAENDHPALLQEASTQDGPRGEERQQLKPQEPGPDRYRQLLITTVTGTEKLVRLLCK